jgi:hypothetical protein
MEQPGPHAVASHGGRPHRPDRRRDDALFSFAEPHPLRNHHKQRERHERLPQRVPDSDRDGRGPHGRESCRGVRLGAAQRGCAARLRAPLSRGRRGRREDHRSAVRSKVRPARELALTSRSPRIQPASARTELARTRLPPVPHPAAVAEPRGDEVEDFLLRNIVFFCNMVD